MPIRAAATALKVAFVWYLASLDFELAVSQDLVIAQTTSSKFSKTWLEEEFSADDVGCAGAGIFPYNWRPSGYGSNMNYFLMAWANAIFEGHNDVAVIVNTSHLFSRTKCDVASNSSVETAVGWSCLFAPMPHLCCFDEAKDFQEFNEEHGMSEADENSAQQRLALHYLRTQVVAIQDFIAGSGVELMEVFANLYEYMLSHLQPWCKADIQSILEEEDIAKMRQGNYVGMHIRRTDKLIHEAKLTETKVYFENAVNYLNSSASTVGVTDITGVWLSTDDDAVIDEVKEIVSGFFPGTTPDSVIRVTGRVPVALLEGGTVFSLAQDRQTYEAMVLLLAEMCMLAGADVFSGTLSSNMGRLVALMRYSLQKPHDSTLSGDNPGHWRPGRE